MPLWYTSEFKEWSALLAPTVELLGTDRTSIILVLEPRDNILSTFDPWVLQSTEEGRSQMV